MPAPIGETDRQRPNGSAGTLRAISRRTPGHADRRLRPPRLARIIAACCSPSTSGTRTSRSASFRAGQLVATRRAMTHPAPDRRRARAHPRRAPAPRRHRLRRHLRDRRGQRRAQPDRRAGAGRPAPGAPDLARDRGHHPDRGARRPPGEVGADRLVNAYAAGRSTTRPPSSSIFGTATTFDCVGADGAYVGGAIAPGLELGLDALATRTAKLPRIELRTPDRAIGRDTVTSIQSGAILGYQALVTGLLRRIREELADETRTSPQRVMTILTGGLANAPWAKVWTVSTRSTPS